MFGNVRNLQPSLIFRSKDRTVALRAQFLYVSRQWGRGLLANAELGLKCQNGDKHSSLLLKSYGAFLD